MSSGTPRLFMGGQAAHNFRCQWCGRVFPVAISSDQLKEWRAGKHIQDVAPELSADDRELIISNSCGDCFDMMFPEDHDPPFEAFDD